MRTANERDSLIRCHLPLARHCARRYHRGAEPLEDLEQVASLALVRAADSFDASRGTAFSSYAVPCILGAIKRHFRDSGWALHVPRGMKDLAIRIEQLAREAPESTTLAELAEMAGESLETIVEARAAYQGMHAQSLEHPDTTVAPGNPVSLLEVLGHEDEGIDEVCDRASLESVLSELDDRDRLLVTLYYRKGQTQAQIGKRLGYSQMHVSRLLRRAVGRLGVEESVA
jgi:RNA polymerase sigma-B factor